MGLLLQPVKDTATSNKAVNSQRLLTVLNRFMIMTSLDFVIFSLLTLFSFSSGKSRIWLHGNVAEVSPELVQDQGHHLLYIKRLLDAPRYAEGVKPFLHFGGLRPRHG